MQVARGEGRFAVVVGATGSIGQRFCEVLAKDGFTVGLGGRDPARLAKLAEALALKGLTRTHIIPMTFDTDAAIFEALTKAETNAGMAISVFVNATGSNRRVPLLDATEDDFDAVMSVNLRAAFLTARAVAKCMVASQTQGRIVQVGSIIGLKPIKDLGLYGASKSALAFLTQSMALEWGPLGISVNAILPGYLKTNLTSDFLSSPRGRDIIDGSPRGRSGRVEDLDGALRLLTSFETDFINGALITIDDGQTLSIR